MKQYKNINGDSGVAAYEHGDNWIHVQFKDGVTYEYRSAKIGAANIAAMQRLADAGNGLNAYINTHRNISKGWSRKW